MSRILHQVAIIGAGQLGRRHLQGLLKSKQPLSIHIVDPSDPSRRAVEDFLRSPEAGATPPVRVHATIEALPAELSLAVVATTAAQRLDAIGQLLRASRVRDLVLEKFLFNDSRQYAEAELLFGAYGCRTWVNTPRRHFDVYRQLRRQLDSDRLLQFTADGGDWGLCCNAVHFVDLAQFLAGASELRDLRPRFDAGVLPSKREGYVELTGEIEGMVGPTRFLVRSIRGSTKPITLTLHCERQTVFVAEGAGVLSRVGEGPLETEAFRLPYQSEMTGTIADQLLGTGTCDLTPYAESRAAHLPLLYAFAAQAGQLDGEHARCAIT